MLFDDYEAKPQKPKTPALPPEFLSQFKIGFLLNFTSGKSTRFDLEPIVIITSGKYPEYKRVSLNHEISQPYLQSLPKALYQKLMNFSDVALMKWMNTTGNRYLVDKKTGSWAHQSVRELKSLRGHYLELLRDMWPELSTWPDVFILTNGKFVSHTQTPVKLNPTPAEFRFDADKEKDEIVIRLTVWLNGVESAVNLCGGFLMEEKGTLYLPPNKEALATLDLYKNGPLRFPLSLKREVLTKYILPWQGKSPITISEKLNVTEAQLTFTPRIRLSELNESNLMLRAEFEYNTHIVEVDNETMLLLDEGDRLLLVLRDKSAEQEVHEYLRSLHPRFANQRMNPYYYLPFDDVMKKGWFIGVLRQLQNAGYQVHGLADLKKFRYNSNQPKFTIGVKSKIDWFELTVSVTWGDIEVPLKEIRRAIMNWEDTIMLEDGTLGHIPEEWVRQYSLLLRTAKEQDGVLRVNKLHFALLEPVLDQLDKETINDIEQRKKRLFEYDSIEKKPLSKKIKADLRPYQVSGYNWLQALDGLGWGGCLADDMGLGKTLQTISFLQFLKEKYSGSTQLVVCPTSLIFNWENELKKFAPTIKFYTHYGMQRDFSEKHFEEYDVVLTTYGLIRNDAETLSGFLWQYIILDESQAIKNPDARISKAVRELRSVNRIILSGTPVQNNTFDLYSQFNFLNPGLLGNREFFMREFANPIDKDGSQEKASQLRKLVYPFILRRTKEQVAKDLPEKTVSVLWCNMEAGQRKLYNEVRDSYRKKVLKKIDNEGLGKSGMDVLEALLRLRQICDHPALVTDTNEEERGSVKINELIREVSENAGGHKFLIFSQFTEMLKLIETGFQDAGITYCYLDGSTPLPARQKEVERFQSDKSVNAFLISLKAGGVGLNLTVADYVYVVDPWWNPAAEQQAIDRAHRIGQKRNVFAYKMICKDSVEEKILQLQERKQKLADDLIQEDAGFVKSLTRDDVDFLLG